MDGLGLASSWIQMLRKPTDDTSKNWSCPSSFEYSTHMGSDLEKVSLSLRFLEKRSQTQGICIGI